MEFYELIANKETMSARLVYLDDGKVVFDQYTMSPHAEVIVEIIEQIGLQNRNPKLLQGGTGGSMSICGIL
jgi:sigma54-dependent transcription regulator